MTNESHLFQYMSFCSTQIRLELMIFLLEKKKKELATIENDFLKQKKQFCIDAPTHKQLN